MIGKVVISKAGRDKGRFAVIVGIDGYALIADGKKHKLLKPKHKNIKHLIITNETIDIKSLTDKELRRLFHERNHLNYTQCSKFCDKSLDGMPAGAPRHGRNNG
jgi:ribosomal protein L14E/L6E/L27E